MVDFPCQGVLALLPTATPDTPVNYFPSGKHKSITGEILLDYLHLTARTGGGEAVFGYNLDDLGTHSIPLGAAMALYVQKIDTPCIMILGHWSSDAFLVYICPQVLEWTQGVSSSMSSVYNFWHQSHARSANNPASTAKLPPHSFRARGYTFLAYTYSIED
jgi:hypothetical protein